MNYKIYIVIITTLFLECGLRKEKGKSIIDCNSVETVYNTDTVPIMAKTSIEKSDLHKAILLDPLWFNSWPWNSNDLSINDYELKWKKDLNISWVRYKNSDYLKSFDTLLVHSGSGLAIDLYSYNTIIQNVKGGVTIEFDVDTKVYLVNEKENRRSTLLMVGSVEEVEDAIWVDNTKILIMGYNNDSDKITPFLWLFDIKHNKQAFYIYKRAFSNNRKSFFLTKYPKAKLKSEEE